MCNFDYDKSGFCENCANFPTIEDCHDTGFITTTGTHECIKKCTSDNSKTPCISKQRTTSSVYNYTKTMQGATHFTSVWFSVQAAHDIHISLSATDPITTASWEIVLGGWGGTRSVIRRSHQGDNLVDILHTREQFLTVCKRAHLI